ncbi:hypothetical protein [Nonomuraea sp. NPDC049028]|uniref:hypothetical protein n=1 Tax=Nonomuraea sp. NPDC049028 TaxID=3364348 RepID=UPI00371885A8
MTMKPIKDVPGKDACSWRQRALAHITELRSQLDGLDEESPVALGAQRHLKAAEEAAARKPSLAGAWSGFAVDRTWANINEAEVALLRLMPDEELPWWGSDVLARALQHLGKQDPRRAKLEQLLLHQDGKLAPQDRTLAVITMQAANISAQQEKARLRSFRNTILVSTAVMAVIALVLAVVGFISPAVIKLCFHDPTTGPACPIGTEPNKWDVPVVELIGLTSASLVGAFGLRRIYGTSAPYMLPVVLSLLKLPAGAVSAVIGLMLIQGRFIPGLSNLDTSAQIIAWAAVFGAAQQIITGLVDEQGQNVLRSVRDSSRGVGKEAGDDDSPPGSAPPREKQL